MPRFYDETEAYFSTKVGMGCATMRNYARGKINYLNITIWILYDII
jgi:hypothetical protein